MSTISNIKVSSDHSKEARHTRSRGSSLSLVTQTGPDYLGFSQNNQAIGLVQAVVEATSAKALVLDPSGIVVYATKSWSSFANRYGLPNNHFQECLNLLDQRDGRVEPTLADDVSQLCRGDLEQFDGEYCYRGIAQPVHFRVQGTLLDLAEAGGAKILLTYKDAASPLEALRKSEQRLSQLLEKTSIVLWEAEAEPFRFTYVNEQAARIFGYPLKKWYEADFLASHIHPDDRKKVLSSFSKQSQKADQYEFTFRLLSKDGRVSWVHNLVRVTRENSTSRQLRGFMIDITERKCAEEALRELGGRLIAAQEEERSRIARELHDDLNQRMALLSIELEQFRQDIDKPVALRKRVKALQKQTQDISTDIHRLSYQLHPSKLDHLGLGAAVKSLCEELSKSGNVKIEVRQQGFPATLPRDITLCIFRVAQEALRNCVKHSGANAAQVVLEKMDTSLRLSISDNGCGFDAKSPRLKQGLGFISMRERINLVDGEIAIYSQPQRGTRIEVSVPLRPINETE